MTVVLMCDEVNCDTALAMSTPNAPSPVVPWKFIREVFPVVARAWGRVGGEGWRAVHLCPEHTQAQRVVLGAEVTRGAPA